MRSLLPLLCALALVSCRGAPSAAPLPVGPAMPDSLGGFRKVGQRVMGGRDSIWRYEAGRTYVSVIRYVIGPDVMMGTDSSEWLAREGDKFARIMPILVQRGEIQSYAVRQMRVQPGPNPPAHEHVGVIMSLGRGRRTVESQYLYIIGGRWLKVRATEADDSTSQSPVPGFARSLANRLARMNP